MPFCEQCGTRLAEETSTCASCGRTQPEAAPAAPPAPPPGYSLGTPSEAPARPPNLGPLPGTPASPSPAARRGFPGPLVPPLAAAIALVVTITYAVAHTLIDWGELPNSEAFITGAVPSLLGSPFVGDISFREWLDYAPFGGGWALAVPLIALIVATALLLLGTSSGVAGRFAIGGLVFVPMVVLTILSTLLNYAIANTGYYDYEGLGEVLLRGAGGAAIIGLLGGLLGALLSVAIRPPRRLRL